MAKQTFSVGQVLSAAQMTSLQATAMGGGTPQTKTASYVLVAADAGTVIQMNAAGATTITVNTSLFSAGDTVQIQNIGAGTCTVTAGTATVNTAGSLALTQYEGGILYFNSASAAVFFDYTQAGLTSPLTTKGDLYTRTSSADSRLAVGTNGYTLVADSTESTGLKWAAPSSGLTLVKTQTIGSAVSSVTVTGAFSSTYDNYLISINGGVASGACSIDLQLGSTATGYYWFGIYGAASAATVTGDNGNNQTKFRYVGSGDTTLLSGQFYIQNPNLAKRTAIYCSSIRTGTGTVTPINVGSETSTTQHTDFTLLASSPETLTGGTIKVYGYQNS